MAKIYSLLIRHRHGDSVTLHATDVDANLAVLAYVKEWWAKEKPGDPMPEDAGEAISDYFDELDDEGFQVDEHDWG